MLENNNRHKIIPYEYKNVQVHENFKRTDICDAFNNLKYQIQLSSYVQSPDADGIFYVIDVFNCMVDPEYNIIKEIPDPTDPCSKPIHDYEKAISCYNQQVQFYTSLVKAETRDFQDIDIFKDKIDYKIADLSCCATCEFSKQIDHCHCFNEYHVDWRQHMHKEFKKLECWNKENSDEYNFDLKPYNCHAHKLDIHPSVDEFGICKNFKLKNNKNRK